jgi:uncharacterized protein (DUF433 family)
MTLSIQTDPVPLRLDSNGTIRVGETRIPLERVIESYRSGSTAEGIVEAFDTLRLADVHAVIAYYLNHKIEVEGYLRERERLAEEVRRKIEASQPPRPGLKEELLRRRAQMENGSAAPGE